MLLMLLLHLNANVKFYCNSYKPFYCLIYKQMLKETLLFYSRGTIPGPRTTPALPGTSS